MAQPVRVFMRVAICACAIVIAGGRAFAQDRGGFTALVDFGLGVQNDGSIEETAVGLTGVNFGIGGFLTRDVALMFRLSGTNVTYDLAGGDYGQTSGVAGPALQFWLSDKFNVEAGAGVGFWRSDTDEDNQGFGSSWERASRFSTAASTTCRSACNTRRRSRSQVRCTTSVLRLDISSSEEFRRARADEMSALVKPRRRFQG